MDNPVSNYYLSQDTSFHLASSDKELHEKVSSILKRSGHLTFSDKMGVEHYLVDGRNGVPALSRNIDNAAQRLFDKNKTKYGKTAEYNFQAIDRTLEITGIPNHLKGYRYIKYILGRLMENDTLVSPISKTVYPEISQMYGCKGFQIDRDIRYAITKSAFSSSSPSPKSFICHLLDMAERFSVELAAATKAKENP
ncbi:MAG: sporulation initiation factor Spo0A C-terminal domain-containing protein [Saccharofermentanales bacterium]